ncbi:MAG TPA: hypothetical protein VHP33_14530 [Polyangiaceae bacterium]|nr:hypothetical protein [Polyangiaceae bacterium]
MALFSVNAHAQDDEDLEETAEATKTGDAKADDGAAKASAGVTVGASADAKAADANAKATTSPASAAEPAPTTAGRPPVYGERSEWAITPYGYARVDLIEDSTQSFEDGIQPNLIARVGTYKGDHRRTIFTARDSRFGIQVNAPTFEGIKSSAQLELDFYGLAPTDARRHDSVVFGPLRIRHAYLKLETSVIDVIAGQYYDLFGWNGSFYPATVGYLGVPAQIYHRNPQIRLEKKLHAGELEVTIAAAAVRPGQRDSGVPDGQGGLKVAYGGWSGAATPGFGRAALAPISVGVSGMYRRFEVPAFKSEPGSATEKTQGYGIAVNVLLPIIPVKDIKDKGNGLTLTGEFSRGSGIADMYTFMDGGSRFPLLPNPSMSAPAIQYQANVDPGLVTFDRNLELKTLNWQGFVAGLQYYLPVGGGRIWIAGIYSQIKSDNIKKLTPFPSYGGIFTKMEYIDGNVGFDITPAIAVGLSFQTVKQTFGDVSPRDPVFGAVPANMPNGLVVPGTGGVAASARNNRGQLSLAMFF